MRKVLAALGLSVASIVPVAAVAQAEVPKAEAVSVERAVFYPGSCSRSLGTSQGSVRCTSGSGSYYAQVKCVNWNGYVDWRYGSRVTIGWWSIGRCRDGYRATAVYVYV